MTLPFTLPDWLPWWVPIVLLVPALLYALAFLFMPFSVIGVKSRLEVIEARLDEIQGEIRHLALRLPETGARPTTTRSMRRNPTMPPRARAAGDDPPADPAGLARVGRRVAARAAGTRRAAREPDRTGGPAAAGGASVRLAAVAVGCAGPVRVF